MSDKKPTPQRSLPVPNGMTQSELATIYRQNPKKAIKFVNDGGVTDRKKPITGQDAINYLEAIKRRYN